MKHIITLHCEASRKYGPRGLCGYLRKEGDACIADKKAAAGNDIDARLFFIALADDYGWNYEPSFSSVTAYLETDGTNLYGGVYDLTAHERTTKKLLASTDKSGLNAPYIYTGEEFAEIAEKITETA